MLLKETLDELVGKPFTYIGDGTTNIYVFNRLPFIDGEYIYGIEKNGSYFANVDMDFTDRIVLFNYEFVTRSTWEIDLNKISFIRNHVKAA